MKSYIKSMALAVTASGLLFVQAANAETKIAIVDVQTVMQKMPQSEALLQAMQTEFKGQIEEITKIQDDIKFNQELAKRNGELMSEKEKKELNTKLGGLIQQFQEKRQVLQQQTQQRESEERNKHYALIQQVIDNIAAKEKYDFVLEEKAALFAKPESNITNKVLEQVSKLK